MKSVKIVVRKFWKCLGSEWWNSARSTVEKRTELKVQGHSAHRGPVPPNFPHPLPVHLLPFPASSAHGILRQVNMRMRMAVIEGKDRARVVVTFWRLLRNL